MASPRLRKARRAARIAARNGVQTPVAAAPIVETNDEEVCEADPCEEEICETHPKPKATKKAPKKAPKKANKTSAKSSD